MASNGFLIVIVIFVSLKVNPVVKATWRGNDLFHLTTYSQQEEKSGQELKGGAWRQDQKERPWRNTAYWPHDSWLAHLAFIYNLGPPVQWWYCPQWDGPFPLNH